VSKIDEIRSSLSSVRPPPIDASLGRILEIQQQAKQKRKEAQQLKLSNLLTESTTQVESITAVSTPDDPEIVSLFSSRVFTISDLDYLKSQQKLLTEYLKILEPLAKEDKSARGGRILTAIKELRMYEKWLARRDLAKQIDEKIKSLIKEQQDQTEFLRSCLNSECSKKQNSRSKWDLCNSCNRGFCPVCCGTLTLATNHASCQHSVSEQLIIEPLGRSEAGSDEQFDPVSEIELNQSTPLSPQPIDTANSPPLPLTLNPNPKKLCDSCGKKKELSMCSRGHERCLRCQRYCVGCARRR